MPVNTNTPCQFNLTALFCLLCNYSHIPQGETNGLLKIKWRLSEPLRMFWLPIHTGLDKKEMFWLKYLDQWRKNRLQHFLVLHPVWLLEQAVATPDLTLAHNHFQKKRKQGSLVPQLCFNYEKRLLPNVSRKSTLESHWLKRSQAPGFQKSSLWPGQYLMPVIKIAKVAGTRQFLIKVHPEF